MDNSKAKLNIYQLTNNLVKLYVQHEYDVGFLAGKTNTHYINNKSLEYSITNISSVY